MRYSLFGWAAARYDLHTPPDHYQHDHRFALQELSELSRGARILDVGCGTGVFLEKAIDAGFDAFGIDVSEQMIAVARQRVDPNRVERRAMQALDTKGAFDGLVSLSWSFNYCTSLAEARSVLDRFASAIRPGGILVLQVAHAAHALGKLMEDRGPGPSGEPDDVVFFYRFTGCGSEEEPMLKADYVYACRSLNELLCETHHLGAADVERVGDLAEAAGFGHVEIYDTWRRDALGHSFSPFLVARRCR